MDVDALTDPIVSWFARRVPAGWFAGAPDVQVDGEEILVTGRLPAAPGPPGARAGTPAWLAQAKRFREDTREQRIRIAAEAERRFGRKVSWGVLGDGERLLFTTLSVPVMTRLRMREREVLDTLIEAGVARSRSDALAWCVRLVGAHQADWIQDLKDALVAVKKVRAEGPEPPA